MSQNALIVPWQPTTTTCNSNPSVLLPWRLKWTAKATAKQQNASTNQESGSWKSTQFQTWHPLHHTTTRNKYLTTYHPNKTVSPHLLNRSAPSILFTSSHAFFFFDPFLQWAPFTTFLPPLLLKPPSVLLLHSPFQTSIMMRRNPSTLHQSLAGLPTPPLHLVRTWWMMNCTFVASFPLTNGNTIILNNTHHHPCTENPFLPMTWIDTRILWKLFWYFHHAPQLHLPLLHLSFKTFGKRDLSTRNSDIALVPFPPCRLPPRHPFLVLNLPFVNSKEKYQHHLILLVLFCQARFLHSVPAFLENLRKLPLSKLIGIIMILLPMVFRNLVIPGPFQNTFLYHHTRAWKKKKKKKLSYKPNLTERIDNG